MDQEVKDKTLDRLLSNISVANKWIKDEIAQIIGKTVAYDYPNLHPNLILTLTTSGLESGDIERIKGSILSLICCFQSWDDRLHTLIPEILPSLYECFCKNEEIWVREKCFKLFTLCLQTCLWMDEVDQASLNKSLNKLQISKWQKIAVNLIKWSESVLSSQETVAANSNLIRLAAKSLQQFYSEIKSKVDKNYLINIKDVITLLSNILPFYLHESGREKLIIL